MANKTTKKTVAKPATVKEKPYGWIFDKQGNVKDVSAPMTADEIKKLKV